MFMSEGNDLTEQEKRKRDRFITVPAIFAIACITLMCLMYIDGAFAGYGFRSEKSSGVSAERRAAVNKIYDANFIYKKKNLDEKKIYVPIYENTDADRATFIAGLFGMGLADMSEQEDYYLFREGETKLCIHKRLSRIEYFGSSTESDAEISSDSEAYEALVDFIRERKLTFAGFNVRGSAYTVAGMQGEYIIRLVEKLGNDDSYAFCTEGIVDAYGNVRSLVMYSYRYEAIARVKLKQADEAFFEMPTDYPEGTHIDLKLCKLVYVFDQGVLQPAYLFEGEADGNTFKCFVNAAAYR